MSARARGTCVTRRACKLDEAEEEKRERKRRAQIALLYIALEEEEDEGWLSLSRTHLFMRNTHNHYFRSV